MDLNEIRKQLHKIPELGFAEKKTQKYILSKLKSFSKLKIHTFDFTGILVEYTINKKSYTLFRADMDGLPVSENTNCGFESEHSGMMHACGHDIHMTILLGLIEKVIQEKPQQNVLFLFQPAEEGKGGAMKILETGILEKFEIESVYALHVNDEFLIGEIACKKGIFFANTQELVVNFVGKSAHVAFPENGKDALAAGANFYLEIQRQIVKKFSDNKKVICGFGKMEAGTAMNAVAANCKLNGTFRAFNKKDRDKLQNLIENVSRKVAKNHKLEVEIKYLAYYHQVVNDEILYNKLKKKSRDLGAKFIEAEQVFTGEDFGFFAKKYKGILFWLGCRKPKTTKNGLHSATFLADENSVKIGVNIFYLLLEQ